MVHFQEVSDAGFSALADPTRRGILEALRVQDASISDLATRFGMTLTGLKKHVALLEDAGLVSTRKVGRVRRCMLGPRNLGAELSWMQAHAEAVAGRLDALADFLDATKDEDWS